MNSLGYNSSYLLRETGLHAEVGCPETLRHKQREDGGAVKSAPLIPLMFELNSNWGGAHLTEQSPSYITHLSSSPWAGERVLYSPVSCSQLSEDQLQFGLNNLNDFWWIAHMGSWESGNRCILENEIGEWVFYVYWYWSETHTPDLCRWMSSQHVGIKAVSCGAVGVVLLFVDFALHVIWFAFAVHVAFWIDLWWLISAETAVFPCSWTVRDDNMSPCTENRWTGSNKRRCDNYICVYHG